MSDDETSESSFGDPVAIMQEVLSSMDTSAVCTGFATVAEWIEADGTPAISLIHTPMPPWHLQGLLDYAGRREDTTVIVLNQDLEDDDGL